MQLAGQPLNFEILSGISNKYGLTGGVLSVKLPSTLAKGQQITLNLQYVVKKPDWSNDMGLFYSPKEANFGQDILITRNWPYYGRYWLPSNDSPDDVATVSYDLSVPDGYIVASNGVLKGNAKKGSGLQSNGLRLFHWSQAKPTTTYNFVFAVAKFDIFEKEICYNMVGLNDQEVDCSEADHSIPMITYFNKNSPDAKEYVNQITKASSAVIYFSKMFGDYAFEKLGFVVSPYPFSMESTSMIVLSQPKSAVHEIIHHWWGDNVHFAHWGDFWISEGFTTYFTGYYDEYKSGTNTTCLDDSKNDLNHSSDTDPNEIFDSVPYCKGAFALGSLRKKIVLLAGAEKESTRAFFRLMKMLYETHQAKKLSTAEFVEFVRLNLVQVLKNEGQTVKQADVDDLVSKWSGFWFVKI